MQDLKKKWMLVEPGITCKFLVKKIDSNLDR